MLSAVVCIDQHGGIGYKNELLFHIKEDMERFKKLTIGHTVIMGSNTWRSIGSKPLPDRKNIIISNTLSHNKMHCLYKNVTVMPFSKSVFKSFSEDKNEYLVIGGESIYKLLLPYCNKIYLTVVSKIIEEVDAHFPELDINEWSLFRISNHQDNGLRYYFMDFIRKNKKGDNMENNLYNNLNAKDTSNAYKDPIEGHDAVNNPSHYCGTKYQVIDFIEDRSFGYCLGNVIKYICRAGKKNPGDKEKELQDLEKALWYLKRYMKELYADIIIDIDVEKCNRVISVNDFTNDQKLDEIKSKIITLISDNNTDFHTYTTKISRAIKILESYIKLQSTLLSE